MAESVRDGGCGFGSQNTRSAVRWPTGETGYPVPNGHGCPRPEWRPACRVRCSACPPGELTGNPMSRSLAGRRAGTKGPAFRFTWSSQWRARGGKSMEWGGVFQRGAPLRIAGVVPLQRDTPFGNGRTDDDRSDRRYGGRWRTRTGWAGSLAPENTSDGHDRAGVGSGTASGSLGAVPASSPRASAASRWARLDSRGVT
jgi:hypothetical protein